MAFKKRKGQTDFIYLRQSRDFDFYYCDKSTFTKSTLPLRKQFGHKLRKEQHKMKKSYIYLEIIHP